MVRAAWIPLLALCCAVAPGAEAKGGVSTRGYNRPTSKSSNAWKYAVGGAVAGAGAYYIGTRLYRVHTRYNDHDSYDEYYNSRSASWRSRHRKRQTNCRPTGGGLRQEATAAWVVGQLVMNKERTNFTAAELEIDLFNELMFRSPCYQPTEATTLQICSIPGVVRALTAADRANPQVCASVGDVESARGSSADVFPAEHLAAKRKLLATGTTIVEIAVGAENLNAANQIGQALQESVTDPTGKLQSYYNTNGKILAYETYEPDSAAIAAPAFLMMITVVLAVLF
eukprot:Rhum_TRINITY_DN22864_c0_g1::Rhum_TRINITY_DN22864_c0_g1_i1::g.176329::m.176329